MAAVIPRRERLRIETVEEIKRVAWEQMSREGSAALSLRAVAREMGMAASALYRYFQSRDDLVTALIVDGFNSLAKALETADAAAVQDPTMLPPDRWLQVARAHREWALAHRTAYGLIFGVPIPDYERTPGTSAALRRTTMVLFGVMRDMLAAGLVDVERLDPLLDPQLRQQLEHWAKEDDLQLPVAAVALCMACWTTLHGAISLEVYERFPPALRSAGHLFEQQMRDVLAHAMPSS